MAASDQERIVESLSQRRQLSDAAKALLADKAFQHAWMELRQRLFGLLMNEKHAGPSQDELCARLRGLEENFQELSLLLEERRDMTRGHARQSNA